MSEFDKLFFNLLGKLSGWCHDNAVGTVLDEVTFDLWLLEKESYQGK